MEEYTPKNMAKKASVNNAPKPYPVKIFAPSPFLYRKFAINGNNNTASEKWGEVRVNADMVSPNFSPKRGKSPVRSDSDTDITIRARNGIRNKNKHKSALLPIAFLSLQQRNALTIKNKAKPNVVGAVSKNAA